MTKILTKKPSSCLKILSVSTLALGLSACYSVPQDSVVATDLSGSLTQVWSGIFSGKLRPAPQPYYAFGASDASLNTPRLMQAVSMQAAAQPHYNYGAPHSYAMQEPFSQNYVPQSRIQPRSLMPQSQPRPAMPANYDRYASYSPQPETVQDRFESETNVPKKRSFGSRIKSVFKPAKTPEFNQKPLSSYATQQPIQTASIPKPKVSARPTRPAQSQPVLTTPQQPMEAYPVTRQNREASISSIPPRATIDDNLNKTGRKTAAPTMSMPASQQDWQTANKQIGESLSYVKMGGGSQISDWQGCEKQAGGYFIPTPNGFIVDPKFDACMRAIGYKSEAEAEAALSVKAAPRRTAPTPMQTRMRSIDTDGVPTSRQYPSQPSL